MGHDTERTPFQTTNWTLVLSASSDPALTSALLKAYQSPINAYIRRCGHDHHTAADFTQEFITRVVLERGLIRGADPTRGRFRSYVKTALRNFLADQHRREVARTAGTHNTILDSPAFQRVEATADREPHDAFDRQWAATLLTRTLERVEEDCRRAGQTAHWAAFRRVVVEPALAHSIAPRMADLTEEIGAADADQVASMVQTVRRKFRRLLRAVVEETVGDPAEVDGELSDLRKFLNP